MKAIINDPRWALSILPRPLERGEAFQFVKRRYSHRSRWFLVACSRTKMAVHNPPIGLGSTATKVNQAAKSHRR